MHHYRLIEVHGPDTNRPDFYVYLLNGRGEATGRPIGRIFQDSPGGLWYAADTTAETLIDTAGELTEDAAAQLVITDHTARTSHRVRIPNDAPLDPFAGLTQ